MTIAKSLIDGDPYEDLKIQPVDTLEIWLDEDGMIHSLKAVVLFLSVTKGRQIYINNSRNGDVYKLKMVKIGDNEKKGLEWLKH